LENAKLIERTYLSKPYKAAEVYSFLDTYIAKREQLILDIELIIDRYEKRRMKEEQAFQSMSNFRRLFSGKKPDHHLAVEYIHYVKKPKEQIRQLREEIQAAKLIVDQTTSGQSIDIPTYMIED
jgi:vacuolar-type H+-ATPase subunit D/Vma8